MAGTLKVGGVTLATESSGTVNLSSNTGLGSVTIPSGTVFPAGHILQVVTNVVSINHAHSSTTKTRVTNGPVVVVTTKQANSKIYLLCDTQTYHYSTRTDFFRSGVGSDTSNLSGNTNGLTGPTGGDTGWENRFYHWVDAPAQPAGTAITYDAVVFGTGGTAINWGSTSYQQRITAFEIAV